MKNCRLVRLYRREYRPLARARSRSTTPSDSSGTRLVQAQFVVVLREHEKIVVLTAHGGQLDRHGDTVDPAPRQAKRPQAETISTLQAGRSRGSQYPALHGFTGSGTVEPIDSVDLRPRE